MRGYLLLALGTLFFGLGYSAGSDPEYPMDNRPEDKDLLSLRDYLKIKREEPLRNKKHALCISGEVQGQLKVSSAVRINPVTHAYERQYGGINQAPVCEWLNRVALFIDYRVYQASFHAKVDFDNAMGNIEGTTAELTLQQGYLMYRILEDGKSTFDGLIGRDKLYNFFDSKVQFNAIFDGGAVRYQNGYGNIVDLELLWAGSVVTDYLDHYGWVGQIALNNLFSTGVFFKYSYSDWLKKSETLIYQGDGLPSGLSQTNNPQAAYQISQFLIGYNNLERAFKIYGAFLYNIAALKHPALQMNERDRIAWYAGFQIGHIKQKGDMASDLSYQVVGAQAVPGWDMAGIGNGNPNGSSIYFPSFTSDPAPFGNTNFQGWQADFMAAVDDNVSVLLRYKTSHSLKALQGWKTRFARFEASVIYAF